MDKITVIEIEGVENVIIDRGNGEFTSMPKSVYETTLASESANDSAGNK